MPKVMKPPTEYDSSATETGADWYDGPPPPPALYKGVVKKMLLTKVAAGEKKGEQRIMVICEISEGKYKGAGVSKWLQLTKQGSPWVNQFLHSLTDGSEEQKKAIRHAFETVGYTVGDMDAKKRLPIVKIGKKTNPIGLATSFVTKLRTSESDGVTRAEIARFVTPFVDNDEGEDDDLDTSTDELEDIEADVDSDADDADSTFTTEDDETVEDTEDQPASEDSEEDPWSV